MRALLRLGQECTSISLSGGYRLSHLSQLQMPSATYTREEDCGTDYAPQCVEGTISGVNRGRLTNARADLRVINYPQHVCLDLYLTSICSAW